MSRALLIFVMMALAVPARAGAATPSADDVSSYRPLRIWHFVLRQVPLERARWMVDRAAEAGFNAVQVTITDGVRLQNAPWQPRQDAWSKEDLRAWSMYVRKRGLKLIPEVKLLTHQDKLFGSRFPQLMYNRSTYDPRREDTYKAVFALLDELIEVTKPDAIHIGHDEVAGHNEQSRKRWLRPGEKMIPADLFVEDILRVNTFLKARNVEVWMWGDMLLSPEEFPAMLDRQMHGGTAGYGKAVRDRLPRSIVICDWHYNDDAEKFPSLSELQKEGFRVIAVTWKKEQTIRNFSRFASRNRAYGMMATSWFYVQRGNWGIVDRLIRQSGEAFESGISSAQ
jgi:hypothetical protein